MAWYVRECRITISRSRGKKLRDALLHVVSALRFHLLACYQTRSSRPARVAPQDMTLYCDLLPNAQYTDRPSKQIHVTTSNPDGMQRTITRKRVKHSLPLSVCSVGPSSALCPTTLVFADINHIRHFLLLLHVVTTCRIACV